MQYVKAFYEHFEYKNHWNADLYLPEVGLDGFNSVVAADHSDIPEQFADNDLFVVNTTVNLPGDLTLTSNTGYLESDNMAVPFDLTFLIGGPEDDLRFWEAFDYEQFSQDFRINGSSDSVDWFVGVSWYEENVIASSTIPFSADFS